MAEPIIKWAGGKRQILDRLTARLPHQCGYAQYFEPFIGGGAVYFALEPENAYISDINRRLINFYHQVEARPEELIGVISELVRDHSEELYYQRRDEFNDLQEDGQCTGDKLREAGLFYYLNQTCFNGLYRENEYGDFNVPYGRQKTMPSVEPDTIREAHKLLQSAVIKHQNYIKIEELVEEDDLVYLDPPYQKLSETANFSHYHKKGFGSEEQDDLRNLAIRLHKKGAHVVITNSGPAKSLYTADKMPDEFRIVNITTERTINSDSAHRTGASEILVTNISPFSDGEDSIIDFRDKEITDLCT